MGRVLLRLVGSTTGGNIIDGGLTFSNLGGSFLGELILADGSDSTSCGDIYLSVSLLVPEPSTLVLSIVGLLGLALVGGRRRRNR